MIDALSSLSMLITVRCIAASRPVRPLVDMPQALFVFALQCTACLRGSARGHPGETCIATRAHYVEGMLMWEHLEYMETDCMHTWCAAAVTSRSVRNQAVQILLDLSMLFVLQCEPHDGVHPVTQLLSRSNTYDLLHHYHKNADRPCNLEHPHHNSYHPCLLHQGSQLLTAACMPNNTLVGHIALSIRTAVVAVMICNILLASCTKNCQQCPCASS